MYSDPKDCLYCQNNQTQKDLMIEIAHLRVSRAFLFKEQTYHGRCLVAYKDHVDDINLLDQRVLASLLDCVATGNVILEREGISAEYGCDTVLIATMNPSDSDISSHLLDRFDLCAYSDFPDAEDGRSEILRRNMSYHSDPVSFRSMYSDDDASVRNKVERAAELLPLV